MNPAPNESPPPPPGGIEVAPRIRVLPADLRIQFARSGGPGGQNVNKLNTKAELWVPLTALIGLSDRALGRLRALAGHRLTQAGEIHIQAETERTQESNRAAVLQRLRELLIAAMHEPRKRRKTRPSRAARQRRLDSKRHRGEIKSARQSRGSE